MTKELDCLRDCNSACCHDLGFKLLTGYQLINLEDHGADFTNSGGMVIIGPCPLLKGQECTIYNNRQLRPRICFDVQPGGPTCQEFRRRDGYQDEPPPFE